MFSHFGSSGFLAKDSVASSAPKGSMVEPIVEMATCPSGKPKRIVESCYHWFFAAVDFVLAFACQLLLGSFFAADSQIVTSFDRGTSGLHSCSRKTQQTQLRIFSMRHAHGPAIRANLLVSWLNSRVCYL